MPWKQASGGYTTKDRGGFVKNPGQYEKLRAKGMSKERAARITNAVNKSNEETAMKDPHELKVADSLWQRGDISKMERANKRTHIFGGYGAASSANKGQGLNVGARAAGAMTAGGVGGAVGGGAAGYGAGRVVGAGVHLASKGRLKASNPAGAIGASTGYLGGALAGGHAMGGRSINRSRSRGQLKPGF